MSAISSYIDKLSSKQVTTSISAAFYGIITLSVALIIGNSLYAKALTILILVLGAVIGWLIAIIISPYTSEEQNRFAKIGQTISVFISGYLLSKLDKPINAYVDVITNKITGKEFLIALDSLNQVRLLGFIISIVVSTIVVYVFRAVEYDLKIVANAGNVADAAANAANAAANAVHAAINAANAATNTSPSPDS